MGGTPPLIAKSAAELRAVLPEGGVLLGLDLGTKTIGTALSDAGWRFATAGHTLPRGKFARDLEALRALARERHVAGIVWVEPFFALNQTSSVRSGFDQLRSFAGISVPLSKRVEIEAGYLNQFLPRASGDIHNDAVPVTLYVRF